jgi:Fe-S-cluster-containing hydrogenase component 2
MAKNRDRTTVIARVLIQASVVGLIVYLSYQHQYLGTAAPIDSYCPFGAIESIPSLLAGEGLLRRVGTSNLVLMGAVGLVTLGLGASFCGWLCPFGAVQDWIGSLGKRLLGRQFEVPASAHRYLKHLRWIVLALIVWMSYRYLDLWFAEYDPYRAFFHLTVESGLALALIVGTVVGSLMVNRFWCVYACPLGAVVGLIGKIGLVKVRRQSSCIDCGLCAAACPMRVPVDQVGAVSDQHCTMCTECVQVCPKPGALVISTGAKGESLPPFGIGIATAALFFALVGSGIALGWWQPGQGCGGCAESPSGEATVVSILAEDGNAVARLE